MLPLSRILYRKRTLPPLSYNNLGLLFVVGLFSSYLFSLNKLHTCGDTDSQRIPCRVGGGTNSHCINLYTICSCCTDFRKGSKSF
ncbi:uncharacterized protein [Glycine max]|uniref:uncharacterized protein isoform X2 n=1 Tax=Glycine max TaxID=3847 RepID=UPI0002339A2B|nr:uncharacterized protein LOC121175049 isoform X2 [Glycine max]